MVLLRKEGEGSPAGVKDAADEMVEGGGPAGVVEGWSTLEPNEVAPFLELLSGVEGVGEEPSSDQRKDIMGGTREHGSS